jgi:hypothetical protein
MSRLLCSSVSSLDLRQTADILTGAALNGVLLASDRTFNEMHASWQTRCVCRHMLLSQSIIADPDMGLRLGGLLERQTPIMIGSFPW